MYMYLAKPDQFYFQVLATVVVHNTSVRVSAHTHTNGFDIHSYIATYFFCHLTVIVGQMCFSLIDAQR